MKQIGSLKGVDYYDTKRIKAKRSRDIILNANFELFRRIKTSLYQNGWLENQGVKPRYGNTPEMRTDS